MKKIYLIISLLQCIQIVQSQIWEEWFRQNSTQKKYLLQQIAAMKVYAGYLEKGYAITRNGLGTFQQLRRGEVNLHNTYFTSLLGTNSIIKKYAAIAGIITLQKDILRECRQALQQFRKSHQFTEPEMAYLKEVCFKLIAACATDLQTLSTLLTNGHFQLKDDERLVAIEGVYASMEDNLTFIRSFTRSNKELAIQRGREVIDIIISKKINALQ